MGDLGQETPGAAASAEPQAPATFDSVAAGVVADFENPTPDAGDTGETPEASTEDAGDLEAEAGDTPEGEDGAEGEGGDQAEQNTVLNALADLPRDQVPEDLLPLYDRLIDARKQMQADYTRKTQAVAQQRSELQEQIDAGVQQALAQLYPQGIPQQGTTEPQAPGTPLAEVVWTGLGDGKPMTIEQVWESTNPADLGNFIVASARQVVAEAMQGVINPRLESLAQYAESATEKAAAAYVDQFVSEHPEVEPYLDEAIMLVERGAEPDLESAAQTVLWKHTGEQQLAQAVELGVQAGAARKAEIDDNKQRFSTPSGSTKPATGKTIRKGMSFDEVAAAVVAEAEGA